MTKLPDNDKDTKCFKIGANEKVGKVTKKNEVDPGQD